MDMFWTFCVGSTFLQLGVGAVLLDAGSMPCGFPNEPQLLEPPICPPTSLKKSHATALAWRFAPEIRFHSLEESFMLDPAQYFQQGSLFAPAFLVEDTGSACVSQDNATCELKVEVRSNLTDVWDSKGNTAQFLHRSWISVLESTFLTQHEKNRLVQGNSFNAQGRSSADMTYTLHTAQDGNAWIMTFHQFYASKGCSNQVLSTRSGSQYDVLQYYLCPDGTQEGDWQHVGLFICPADLQAPNTEPQKAIRRVHYSQHDWLQEYDCSKQGQCPFEDDAQSQSKLVAYSGLFSHANYPKPADLWVHTATELNFLNNLDGLYKVDSSQGSANEGRRWVPTAQNVRYVPPAAEISETSPDAWALFPGSWGSDRQALDTERAVTCFLNNFTSTGNCDPDSESFQVLSRVLDVNASKDHVSSSADRFLGSDHNSGPLQRDYTYTWLKESPAPIYQQQESPDGTINPVRMLECPATQDTSTLRNDLTEEIEDSRLLTTFHAVLGGVLAVALATGLLLLLTAQLSQGTPTHRLLSEKLQGLAVTHHGKGVFTPTEERVHPSAASVLKSWVVPVIAITFFILGAILVSFATTDAFEALKQVYPWKPWDTVLVILVTLLVVGVVTDVIVVLLITGATPKTQNCSILPCCTPRESGLTRALQHHMGCNLVLSVVVVLQLMLAVGLFACGLLLLIARALLSEGCKSVQDMVPDILDAPTEQLEPVCLDLTPLGLNSVECGAQVVGFCNAWVEVKASYVLWGCLCILLSHLLMLQLLYRRGHTLRLLLALEQFSEKLSGRESPGALGSSSRFSKNSVVSKGGVSWTIGKPTSSDPPQSARVAASSDDRRPTSKDAAVGGSPLFQHAVSSVTNSPKYQPPARNSTEWQPMPRAPLGSPHSQDKDTSPSAQDVEKRAARSPTHMQTLPHVELSPTAQRATGHNRSTSPTARQRSSPPAQQRSSPTAQQILSPSAKQTSPGAQRQASGDKAPRLRASGDKYPRLSHGADWEPVVVADRRTLQRVEASAAQNSDSDDANTDSRFRHEPSFALRDGAGPHVPERRTVAEHIQHVESQVSPLQSTHGSRPNSSMMRTETGSWQTVNEFASQGGQLSLSGGNSEISGTSSPAKREKDRMGRTTSSWSPSNTLKRDVAVQHRGPDSPTGPSGHARENPLFEEEQDATGSPYAHDQHTINPHERQKMAASATAAPSPASNRDNKGIVNISAGPVGSTTARSRNVGSSKVPFPDSPPRRKGPQPRGTRHLAAGSQRQNPQNPGFEQEYSPSNPPKDIANWRPRGKGFVTII